MQIDYRQGILRGQIDAVYQTKIYLQRDVNYINLNVSPTNLFVTIAHKNKNYLIQEPETVRHAWGPLPLHEDCLLYWDINVASGKVTRGYTIAPFTYGMNPPVEPVLDAHWFDLANMQMNVWSGTAWVNVIRCFAGKFTKLSAIECFPFASQINDSIMMFSSAYVSPVAE